MPVSGRGTEVGRSSWLSSQSSSFLLHPLDHAKEWVEVVHADLPREMSSSLTMPEGLTSGGRDFLDLVDVGGAALYFIVMGVSYC